MIEHRDDGPYWEAEIMSLLAMWRHQKTRRDTERVFKSEELARVQQAGRSPAGLPVIEEVGFRKAVPSTPEPGKYVVDYIPVGDERDATIVLLKLSIPLHPEDGGDESG